MISIGLPACEIFSSSGRMSFRLEIFFSWMSSSPFSSTHSIVSFSVMKYGER